MSAQQFGKSQTIFLLALLGAVTIAVSIMWMNDDAPLTGPPAGGSAVEVTGSSVEPGQPAVVVAPGVTPDGGGVQGQGPVPGVSE